MTAVDVPPPVRARLAEIAAAMKAETGRAVSYGDVIEYLLAGRADG